MSWLVTRMIAASVTIAMACCAARASAAEPAARTGPWNVPRLLAADVPLVVDDKDGSLWAVHYPGETYEGHPTSVFAYFATPTGEGPFPAMVLVHGGGGKAFAEWARLWAERGYVALAMDLAGNGRDGQRLADGGPPQDDGAKFLALEDHRLEDTWPYQAVANVIRAHAALAARPEVDPNRIGITGISWGGYLTCIVSGIDHQLKVAVPVYGCGFLGDNSSWREAGIFDKLSPSARGTWLSQFDPSQYLPGVRSPILFISGTNDRPYPLDSYRKSYELVTAAPRTLCVTVNMPHGHQQGWAPPEIGAFVDSVLKGGKTLARLSRLAVSEGTASAQFAAVVPVTSAALHYTLDTGPWPARKLETIAAEVDADARTISAKLPKGRPLVAFLTVVDERGLTVSTDHQVLDAADAPATSDAAGNQ